MEAETREIEALRFPSRVDGRVVLATLGGADLRALESVTEGVLEGASLHGPGLALALAEALEQVMDPGTPWLALSVGPAVVEGLPTAARLSLSARTPGRAGVVEAQVGGTFARGFARTCDVLLLVGAAGPAAHMALRIERGGEVTGRVVGSDELAVALRALEGRAAALRTDGEALLARGRAGDLGLPLSNVASLTSEEGAPPSFVGRGGMGAAFARVGLVGIAVGERAEGAAAHPLTAELIRSPRLLSRAHGGTLELGASLGEVVTPGERGAKHGCKGCPTPCGWTFRAPGESAAGGRFSALRAAPVGMDPMDFVARCNALGLDAQGAGRVIAELGGTPEDLVESRDEAVRSAMAAQTGTPAFRSVGAHGADLAARVGALASARGPEPLRSLSVFGPEDARAAEAVAPLPWSGGEDRAADVASLAHLHGAFAAALDMAGFCAFSAAGLVADGVLSLDEVAARIAPPAGWWEGASDRLAMLRAGEAHLARHRRMGAQGTAPPEGADGELRRAVARAQELESGGAFRSRSSAGGSRRPSPAGEASLAGDGVAVTVLARGLLGLRLGAGGVPADPDSSLARIEVEIAPGAPLTVSAAVRALAAQAPAARDFLLAASGDPLPAVLRGGRVLGPCDKVARGDVLELVLVIAGG